MMRPLSRLLCSCVVLLGACATGTVPMDPGGCVPSVLPQEPDWNIRSAGGTFSATLGWRGMDDTSFWKPLEDQFTGGVEFALRPGGTPLAFDFGISGAYQRDSVNSRTLDTYSVEFFLGPKLFLDIPKSPIRLYAGAGPSLAYVNAELTAPASSFRSNDLSFGVYAQLGAMFMLNRTQSIGLEYRTLRFTDVQLGGFDGDADYNQLAFVFAYDF